MAAYTRVRRLVNPRRKATVRRKRKTAKAATHRRRTPPRNPDGSFKKRKTTRRRSAAVKTRTPRARATVRKRKTVKRNPAYLLTFGSAAANPRRRSTVTKSRKRKKTVNRRRRSNPTRVVVVAPRANRKRRSNKRHYTVHSRKRMNRRRRNPVLFGQNMSPSATAETIAGVLAGVAGTKIVVGYMPASLVGIGGSWGKVIASGVAAFLLGMVGRKIAKGGFGDGVLLGGLAQTGSVAINALSPSLGAQFGLGELISGSFPVPQNPVMAGRNALAAAPSRVTTSGLARAYAPAY